ncbi:multiple inositol polyphosphate phosphatase 1-like [Drosophila albomicans]|uniref:Multiple inositol polyphosphate phosphatase 1 n=1 Tax=Drosophila albomicans TaxID=7291 RepID=A0A6P8XGG8_DROAB|nr:multiple inositol polyphosphate phosphatase 1-like [Drosophila albomicans]
MGDGSEFKKFITGAIYNNTIANITKRLRLSKLYKEDIDMMYKMCRFELAWKPKESSVWCAVFRPEEVTVLNYAEELKNYYGSGYGFNASDKLNCLVVQDLLTVLNSTESPNVVAYFAHSPGLQMLLVSLGIAKDDEKLRADNFENMANRKWKLSELVPFGANFVAVKYNCSEAADNVTEKALFFLNEKPVEFKWCKNGLCNWSDVLKTYHIFSDANCKEFYCKKEKPKQTKEEHNSIENEINGVVQNVSEVAGSFVKGAENAADTFVKGAENAADTFAKGAENTFKTIKNIVNAGETIAPLMVTTLLTVIVRQLVL